MKCMLYIHQVMRVNIFDLNFKKWVYVKYSAVTKQETTCFPKHLNGSVLYKQ